MHDALDRYVTAQETHYDTALGELAAGDKRTHWMWFVFPQLRGLGHSVMAQHYGIASLAEAKDYWGHALLGPRLRQCVETVLAVSGRTAHQIFHSPDDLKFCSCMTLFEVATRPEPLFAAAIDRYYAGRRDAQTLALLRR